jgi:HSP20 family protein
MKWGISRRGKDSEHSVDLFRKNFNSLFDDFFSTSPSALFDSDWLPIIDVEEDEREIHVQAEMPGLEEKDINVTLDRNILTISGEKKEERDEENKEKKYALSERRFGSFSRSITLPEGVKTDEIKAKFKKGVLNIRVPRDKKKQAKKIEIK